VYVGEDIIMNMRLKALRMAFKVLKKYADKDPSLIEGIKKLDRKSIIKLAREVQDNKLTKFKKPSDMTRQSPFVENFEEKAKKDFLKPKIVSTTDKVKKIKNNKKPNLKVVKRKGGQIGDKLVQSFYD
tara:strand:- start:399 stop:782 length:384 start_codon:yes stop_codon:yes gene_type:complete